MHPRWRNERLKTMPTSRSIIFSLVLLCLTVLLTPALHAYLPVAPEYPGLSGVAVDRVYLAAGTTDMDEEATISDPGEEATIGDPGEQATVGDAGERATVGDSGEKAGIGDPGERAGIGDPDEQATVGDPGEAATIGDPGEKSSF